MPIRRSDELGQAFGKHDVCPPLAESSARLTAGDRCH